MRAVIRTTIIRDTKGYTVHDYGEPQRGMTLASAPPSGIHIVGNSGTNEKVFISSDQNLRLWKKVCRLESPEDVAVFMSKWGQISRWPGDESRPYSESYLLIELHLSGIKHFAGYVDMSDKIGFCYSLRDQLLVERANFVIDTKHPEMPLVIETTLLRFMLLEMWNEFGGEHPARWGVQNCRYCDHPFQVGGRRGTQSRLADARYCSESCKNMASRARTANRW